MTEISNLIEHINSVKNRPSWEQYFVMMACVVATRSTSQRLHVGCVITKNKRILATGYNGMLPGVTHDVISDPVTGRDLNTIHAEVNAVAHSAKFGIELSNSTCFVTHFPCLNCTKTLISSGISEIIYVNDYHNDPVAYKLLEQAGIVINKFSDNTDEHINNGEIHCTYDNI